MSTAGSVVELAARLDDWATERGQPGPDLDVYAQMAVGLDAVELTRMANRLRDAVAALYRRPADEPARVPAAPLGEVWDAPVRVWQYDGKTTHITAVAVHARLYLDTHGGPPSYEVPRHLLGAQVIARAAVAGQPDAFAVFWRLETEGYGWRQVTGDLAEADMVAWDGRQARYDDQRGVMTELAAWLDQVVTGADDSPPAQAFVSDWAGALTGGAQ